MSGETVIDTAEEGTVLADSSPEDVFSNAEQAAVDNFTAGDNAEDEGADEPAEDTVEAQNSDEPEGDPEPEASTPEEPAEPAQEEEFDASTLPDDLREKYDSAMASLEAKQKGADKYFNSRAQEHAAKNRELEVLLAEARASSAEARGTVKEAEVEEHPWGPMPELPSGEGITQESWNAAQTKQSQWLAEEARLTSLKELKDSGQFVSAQDHADNQRKEQNARWEAEVIALPGYNREVEDLMLDAMINSPIWKHAPDSREGMMELAEKAIAHVGAKTQETAAATKAEAKVRKQATAASRATPRVTSPKGASAEDVFAKEGFKSENEKMAYAEKLALEQYGG